MLLMGSFILVSLETWLRWKSGEPDQTSTRLNCSHSETSYAVSCLKKIRKLNQHIYPVIKLMQNAPQAFLTPNFLRLYTVGLTPARATP